MKRFAMISLTALNCVQAEEVQWTALFNGKNLTGESPKFRSCAAGENFKHTFRVQDGVIKVDYSNYESRDNRFGHLFFEKKFSYYRLRMEYRFTGEQIKDCPGWALCKSGIMIHNESPTTMEVEQDFPTSLEVQLLAGNGKDDRQTGNLSASRTYNVMDNKLRMEHCITSPSRTFHGEQWFTIEVKVGGNESIRHSINGEKVISYSKHQLGADAHADALAKASVINSFPKDDCAFNPKAITLSSEKLKFKNSDLNASTNPEWNN